MRGNTLPISPTQLPYNTTTTNPADVILTYDVFQTKISLAFVDEFEHTSTSTDLHSLLNDIRVALTDQERTGLDQTLTAAEISDVIKLLRRYKAAALDGLLRDI